MISVNSLRQNTVFTQNGNLLQVLEFSHIKMARGGAVIKTKVKFLCLAITIILLNSLFIFFIDSLAENKIAPSSNNAIELFGIFSRESTFFSHHGSLVSP